MLLILMILFVTACSTSPTLYVPLEDNKGYSDKIVDTDLRVASFQGNSATKKEDAELYAKFRAIEICQEMGQVYTHILVVQDKTYSKDILQTSSTGPSYYYGMSPYYGRYCGYGGMSYGMASTTTTSETYTYPLFEVYFECVDRPLDARVSLKNLSSSQMQNLVKDLQGAVQIDDVLSDSPNKGKLKSGDIIITANGQRVDKVLELFQASRRSKQKNFRVEFFRDGVKKETTISFLDVTELVAQAQEEIIKSACKMEGIKDKKSLCLKK